MMKQRSPLVLLALVLGLAPSLMAQQGRPQLSPEEQARRQAERERQFQEELVAPRPIEALNSVWLEELTWMEVRDAMAAGKTTAIVSTGGIEQNGPYLALGKHNVVLRGACEGIARELGNALCAPIIKLVPEGGHEPPTSHMRYPGTLSLTEETFQAVLEDVATSLRAHGFEHVVFIGDSGGNQNGMRAVAERLSARWSDTGVHFIPEFYRYGDVTAWMKDELGIEQPTDDGIHDDFVITSLMMITDPSTVRYEQRVKAGKATINGLSIADLERTQEIGRKLMAYRVRTTADAIRAAIRSGRSN